MNFKSFPRRVAASCCCVRHYAIFSENSRTVVKHEYKKIHAGRGAVGKIAVLGMRERGGRVKGKVLKNTGAE